MWPYIYQKYFLVLKTTLGMVLSCSKTCLAGLLIRSIFRGKNCTSASARVQFFLPKSNELTDQQDMFCLITHLLSIRATISRKTLIDKKIEAQTLTRNPTGNSIAML